MGISYSGVKSSSKGVFSDSCHASESQRGIILTEGLLVDPSVQAGLEFADTFRDSRTKPEWPDNNLHGTARHDAAPQANVANNSPERRTDSPRCFSRRDPFALSRARSAAQWPAGCVLRRPRRDAGAAGRRR